MFNSDNDFSSTGLPVSSIRPGYILKHEFLTPFNVELDALAAGSNLDTNTLRNLIHGDIELTPEIGARLDAFFGNQDGFWYSLQEEYSAALEAQHVR